MGKLLIGLVLMSLSLNGYTALEAVGVKFAQKSKLDSFVFKNNVWENTFADNDEVISAYYQYVFHDETTKETLVFGYLNEKALYGFVVACKSDFENKWRDCTPDSKDIPKGNYYNSWPAHDGKGGYMLIGIRDDSEKSLIALCRNASHEWSDCSPGIPSFFDNLAATVSYGNNQWLVATGEAKQDDRRITTNTVMCMDATARSWSACDISAGSTEYISIDAIQYVSASHRWVAVGSGFNDEMFEDAFISICRNDGDTIWSDCAGDLRLPDGFVRLMQNKEGELLLLADQQDFSNGIDLTTNVLCFPSDQSSWENCTGSLNDEPRQLYLAGVTDENDDWILFGNYPNESITKNVAYLTAKKTATDWNIVPQAVIDDQSLFLGVFSK